MACLPVFKSKQSEMEFVIAKDGSDGQNVGNSDAVVRLRGLPFICSHEDVVNFFKGNLLIILSIHGHHLFVKI